MMRTTFIALAVLFVGLQYRLWWGDGGRLELRQLREQAQDYDRENTVLRQRNAELARQVMDLKRGQTVLEQRAREELGLTREDEVYYQFVEPEESAGALQEEQREELPAAPKDEASEVPAQLEPGQAGAGLSGRVSVGSGAERGVKKSAADGSSSGTGSEKTTEKTTDKYKDEEGAR